MANRLGIGIRSVVIFESGERVPAVLDQRELQRVFGAARIEFTNGEASGVKLRLAGAP